MSHAKNTTKSKGKLSKDMRSFATPFNLILNSTIITCITVTVNTTGHLPTQTNGKSRSVCMHLTHLGPINTNLFLLIYSQKITILSQARQQEHGNCQWWGRNCKAQDRDINYFNLFLSDIHFYCLRLQSSWKILLCPLPAVLLTWPLVFMWARQMELKYAAQPCSFVRAVCKRDRGTPSPLFGLDLHCHEPLDNLMADNGSATRHQLDAHSLCYEFVIGLLASPQSGKEDRQAAELNFNHCVQMGGGDAAWLRHQLTATSHQVIANGLQHGAHSW